MSKNFIPLHCACAGPREIIGGKFGNEYNILYREIGSANIYTSGNIEKCGYLLFFSHIYRGYNRGDLEVFSAPAERSAEYSELFDTMFPREKKG